MIKCFKCQKEFEDSDSIMVCSRCGAMYHKDCWFSEVTCKNPGCGYDRGMPLRGENLDPNMTDDYIKDLLADSKTKEYTWKKIIPIIIATIIFVTWIALNSYHDYQKHHTNNNTVTFTEKK